MSGTFASYPIQGSGGGGSGTVTSVGLSDGSSTPIYTISNSPVTTSGTLTFTLTTQTANFVFAGPSSGSAAQPGFRALVAGDIPSLSGTYLVKANNLSDVANAATSFKNISPLSTAGDIIYENATPLPARLAIGSTGQVLTVAGGLPSWAAPATAGTVTSVAMTVPTFLSIAGSPITSSGTLAVTLSGTALPITSGGTGVTSVTTVPTASSFAGWDANSNFSTNNLFNASTSTVSNGGTINMTVASTGTQVITGTSTEIFNLPDATTLPPGTGGAIYFFNNNSTAAVTINNHGGSLQYSLGAGGYVSLVLVSNSTSNGVWTSHAELMATATSTNSGFTHPGTIAATSQVSGTSFLSSNTTGTAPLFVSSTTVVANLNSAAVGGITVTGTPGIGNVLTATSSSAANWAAPATAGTVTSVAMTVPTFLSIAGSPITSSGTLAVTLSGTALPILNGGTGQTTAAAAYNALSPMTTTGDIEYESGTNTASRLAIGSTGNVLTVAGGIPSWAAPATAGTVTSVAMTVPTFLSISGSPITSSGTLAVTLSGTALPIANGGTASTTAAAAFNALNPMTTTGDIIYESGTGVASRLAIGSSTQVLTVTGGIPVWAAAGGGGTSTPTANTTAQWDSNVNMSANNFISSITTNTAGSTYTLTVTSTENQFVTGGISGTTINLPVVSTLTTGHRFNIHVLNGGNTNAIVTVKSSGGNTVATLQNGNNNYNRGYFIFNGTAGTGTSSWDSIIPLVGPNGSTTNGIATFVDGGGNGLKNSAFTLSTTPSSTSAPVWDSSLNLFSNNFSPSYTTTATAGGTTTLTVASNYFQYWTGSSNQTIKLPVPSTFTSTGISYYFVNNSTGTLSIQSSGANAILSMAPSTQAIFTAILISGTTAASWSISQYGNTVKSALTQISTLRSAAISLTTATTANVCTTTTKLTLTAGSWIIYGTVGFSVAATTTITNMIGAISKTSATLPATDTYGLPTAGEYTVIETFPALALNGDFTLPLQGVPVSLTASTDYYLVAQANFGISTVSVYGSMYAIAV